MHLSQQEMILRVEGLKKVFRSGESDLVLFENLSFQVARGEMLAIVGESGSGKSTLLHILGALDRASVRTRGSRRHRIEWQTPSHQWLVEPQAHAS